MAFNHDRECISHNIKKDSDIKKRKRQIHPFSPFVLSYCLYCSHTVGQNEETRNRESKRCSFGDEKKKKSYVVLGMDICSLGEQQRDYSLLAVA